jgi:hypothetical protein
MAHTLSVRIKGVTFTAESPGASDIGGEWPVKGHAEVKRLSYNGRLWTADQKEWVRS